MIWQSAVVCSLLLGAEAVSLEKRLTVVNAKPKADGTCYLHTMAKGESCSFLIEKFSNVKSVANLNTWNELTPTPDWNGYTFGWYGCSKLTKGQKICLSAGTAPKPTTDENAQCGATAPGDLYNTECPLNACCSQYGYCGITSDYCATTTSTTGAPGTFGCQSNCGYGSLHTSQAKTFRNIIYWLDSTGDLASDPTQYSTSDYDTMHYAFVNINSDLTIDTSKLAVSDFLKVSQKKVVSFGGWDFSTSTSTYEIFRNIVSTSTSRSNFASQVVQLISDYDLDGVDLDWEYPAETGIADIPDDYSGNGKKFLSLIKTIKGSLPSGKTLSVAIPATYNYLKNYPVADMQSYVDYFVFMTYDLHGTWDDSTTTGVQCHTDLTAISDAMLMLDKAGVKMWKLVGGIATYGHTYKLSSTSCTALGCAFSGAGDAGSVTNSAGILADSEINAISSSSKKVKRWSDSTINCDIMVYNTNNWVAWPKASERATLKTYFKDHAMGGSAIWAGNYLAHSAYTP
ncbi:hypothetical protein CANTEDRAFT_116318 [Yamadazyma tenuis ATCC 10573]|uniref:Uncharacterized protein n=1 Tax=Candida tenuis (strain ATCC 10573 / BCRC 21748 / CBS 615 / JCM 9827 / NBRC 10315 / NRRL Y-1498 / VKM Y-70) TaxID=590646 RepID=G3BD74_CANTC|nr:uncharacterized protein CANTEDRAFT_116318 [Yamadazyma tenuis ATCC 10573]EGV61073.1 hypothetical protein CANTEDRAFT_116318 [Yamadazyma tenuis ATCC 10573]